MLKVNLYLKEFNQQTCMNLGLRSNFVAKITNCGIKLLLGLLLRKLALM